MVNISDIYTAIFDSISNWVYARVMMIKKRNSKYETEMEASQIEMEINTV